MKRGIVLTLLVGLVLLFTAQAAFAGPLPGAIFTTMADGSVVNANTQYQAKEDVYLDGGPGPNAPVGAAGLPAGDYYFQVTDPSGKVLLSVDPIASRKIRVNEYGVIDKVYDAPTMTKYKGKRYGTHLTGVDLDHGESPWDAITVQLMPYEDTPNPGGVYKVWITPVDKYSPGEGKHGFIPSWSKTDNYKVKGRPKCEPTYVSVKKFHDLNANGVWDDGEPELNWDVVVTDPLGVENTGITPFTEIVAPSGKWYFEELFPALESEFDPGWMQTALYVDGVAQPLNPKIGLDLEECQGKTVTIVYGNVKLACVKASKYYDKNANGVWDDGEEPIEGFKFHLTGTNVRGEVVDMVGYTGEKGRVRFCGLLPGDYKIAEVMPEGNWMATTPECYEFVLATGDYAKFRFGNICFKAADFNTKGFWHNKNGLDLIQPEWIDYVNGLDPYSGNPFDGLDAEGNPVPAAKGPAGETIAGEGTALAEISAYLVGSNAGGDPKIQLGQQLLAFIFNVKYNGAGAIINGSVVSTESMIEDAIAAWNAGGSDANRWAGVLDGYNNNDCVKIACSKPCPIVY